MRLKKQYITDQVNHSAKEKRSDTNTSLHQLEKLNIHLEEIVALQNKKMADIKATNSKFISIIAHDLRSPFSSIIGVLEILKDNLNDYRSDDFEEYVNIAYDSACSTLNLLDSLLEWTLSQRKHESFNPVIINLLDLLDDEIRNINTSAEQKEILIHLSIPHGLNVLADLQMVKTIFRNLISNSVKYTNRGGEITISASKDKSFAEISVKDNGIGIPSKTLNSLFRIDSIHSTYGTNNEKGTGFGLILCKDFIEHNGGVIWIESEQGKGCETIFTLPLSM